MYNFHATGEPDIGASQPTNKYISGQKGTDGGGKELFTWGSQQETQKVIVSAEMQKTARDQGGLGMFGKTEEGNVAEHSM